MEMRTGRIRRTTIETIVVKEGLSLGFMSGLRIDSVVCFFSHSFALFSRPFDS